MKLNNSLKSALALTVGASLFIGCAEQSNSSATKVTSSFKMTGSGSTATVATNKKPSKWNALINSAYALVPSSIVDSTGAVINLSSAWTVIKEVEFKSGETAGAEDSESEVEFKGPYFVNLLSNTPVTLDTKAITQKILKELK